MKKIAVGIAAVIGLSLLAPASAEAKQSIVIIDTAIDSTASQIKNNLIHEVCILEIGKCPNGTQLQEGPGAATLPVSQAYSKGFEHGTIMSSIATSVNPDVSIIFIRIAGIRSNGLIETYTDRSLLKALDWVVDNKQKYNIVSVSSSMGHHLLDRGTNYCPIRGTGKQIASNIDKLIAMGVPTIFSTGNGSDLFRIDYPACIPQAISISSVNEKTVEGYRISMWANTGPDVDYYALGIYNTAVKRATGTSAAAVAFSAYWSKVYRGNYQDTISYINSMKQPVENSRTKATTFIDVLK